MELSRRIGSVERDRRSGLVQKPLATPRADFFPMSRPANPATIYFPLATRCRNIDPSRRSVGCYGAFRKYSLLVRWSPGEAVSKVSGESLGYHRFCFGVPLPLSHGADLLAFSLLLDTIRPSIPVITRAWLASLQMQSTNPPRYRLKPTTLLAPLPNASSTQLTSTRS